MQEYMEYIFAGLVVGQTTFNFYVANKLGLFDDIKEFYTNNLREIFNPEKLIRKLQRYETSPTI